MAEEILNKKIAEKLMKTEGKIRGMVFKTEAAYVIAKKGETGLKKVEEELEKVGCPMKYKEIRTLGFYPIGWRAISLLALRKVLGWGDEEFREMGRLAVGDPLIVKVYVRFFGSIGSVVKMASRIYGEYFTEGKLVVPDYDEGKKYVIAEIRGLDLVPGFCRVVEGYLVNMVNMVIKAEEIRCRETKCTFEGQDRHQFKVTWE